MYLFSRMGMFVRKPIKARAMAPLAAAYIGYIVLCNLNLNINTVSDWLPYHALAMMIGKVEGSIFACITEQWTSDILPDRSLKAFELRL